MQSKRIIAWSESWPVVGTSTHGWALSHCHQNSLLLTEPSALAKLIGRGSTVTHFGGGRRSCELKNGERTRGTGDMLERRRIPLGMSLAVEKHAGFLQCHSKGLEKI